MDLGSPKGTQNNKRGGEEVNTRNIRKNKSNWKKAEIVAIFAIIEVISLVLWQKAEDFSGISGKFIHWVSECGFLAGGAYLAYKFTRNRTLIWVVFAVLCIALLLTKSVEPRPHFKVSLRIGDSPDSEVYLTNDFLFNRRLEKIGDLSNGRIVFNSFVNGCLVIPVQEGESNKVFNFSAENDSSLKVNDLILIVGFPKPWECRFDPIKWHKANESFRVPDWKFDPTNMQFIAAQCPWVLFPNDTADFPSVTNPCIPEYIGSTFKGGLLELSIRSTGFENIIAVNIVFFPVSSNSFKPYVALAQYGADGQLLVPMPQ